MDSIFIFKDHYPKIYFMYAINNAIILCIYI